MVCLFKDFCHVYNSTLEKPFLGNFIQVEHVVPQSPNKSELMSVQFGELCVKHKCLSPVDGSIWASSGQE